MPDPTPTPPRQTEIYLAGATGRRPRVPVDAATLEDHAWRTMTPAAYAYVAGGAGAERTMRANRAALDRHRIVPRMLRDVSVRDTSLTLFGRRLPHPFVVAPIGVLELAHRDADLAVARAAASLTIPAIFSSQASVAMETCARAMADAPRWFQLYWSKDDELVESFAHRAEACGCDAIVVTLDTTLLGWRPRDLDLAHLPFLRGQGIAQYTSDPVFMRKLGEPLPGPEPPRPRATPAALGTLLAMARAVPGGTFANIRSGRGRAAVRRFIATYSRPSLTWDDLPFLRARTKLPIVLKGILHPDDARRAIDAGVDGVYVSNHGGRQVDGAIGAIEALAAIADAVAGRVPVLVDSGIRTGADAFKALALGATAVGIGRPYVYGLALAGEVGVREVLANFCAELELTMALSGCKALDEVQRECLATSP